MNDSEKAQMLHSVVAAKYRRYAKCVADQLDRTYQRFDVLLELLEGWETLGRGALLVAGAPNLQSD